MKRTIAPRMNGFEQGWKLRWRRRRLLCCAVLGLAAGFLSWAATARAQVITIDKNGNVMNPNGKGAVTVDRRYQQITPTHIQLSDKPLDSRSRLALERFLQADHGFAMRPFPGGHKGLMLVANGDMKPYGENYVAMVTAYGVSSKPGERLVVTDVKVDRKSIVLDLNGGPDPHHRFLRHIQVGTGPMMGPVVADDGQQPTGSRLTLLFPHGVPELTGKEAEALLSPLISFEVKSPLKAYTDTLPPKLKEAVLAHHVLVGMDTDMVLFTMGHPLRKMHEMDGQMPVDIWIYGKPPQPVDFVRINGNRVIRVEVAAVGKPIQVFDQDEVEGLMRTDGTPIEPVTTAENTKMGDVHRDPDTQIQAAPPSLRNPGEKLPQDDSKSSRVGVMRPVQFPTDKPDDTDSTDASAGASKPAAQSGTPSNPAGSNPQTAPPATGQQQAPSQPPVQGQSPSQQPQPQ